MSIETEEDWKGLREVGRVTRLVLAAMRRHVKPGATTGEVGQVAGRVLAEHDARHAPRIAYGFPGDACISVNDEAVHGIPGDRVIRRGDLVKLDVVVEKNGYLADAAVTVAVPPSTDEARRLVECARAAFQAAMQVARAGHRVNEIGRVVEREVRGRGFAVVRDLCGHGIGRSIHEEPTVPNQFDFRLRNPLTDGLVITVEPIVSAGSGRYVESGDGWTCRTADGSLTAHYEHTLVVTRRSPVLLTAA